MLNKNYYKREDMIEQNAIPTRKEIRQSLKNHLTNAYFAQLDKDAKILLGLEPPLQGPGEELWVYPEDEFNDNTVLKPVTTKEIQALTHTGILEYGDKELEQIERDKRERIERAVMESNEIWWHFTRAHTKGCVKEAVRKERETQNKDILALVGTFNEIYKNGLDDARTKFDRQTEVLITELRDVIRTKNCCEQDKKRVKELTDKMKEECQKRVVDELSKQKEHFESVLMLEQARFTHEMKERIKQLRHDLECRGVVDILYMACMEKHYYHLRQIENEKSQNDRVSQLTNALEEFEEELRNAKIKLMEKTREAEKLKENMSALCREFRRLFSCHTHLPFEQLGFLPQFEKIFIESVYEEGTCKRKSKKSAYKLVKQEAVKEKDNSTMTTESNGTDSTNGGYSYVGSSFNTESDSKNTNDSFFNSHKFNREIVIEMIKNNRKSLVVDSQASKLSMVINSIIQQAKRGMRTSILKTGPLMYSKKSVEVETKRMDSTYQTSSLRDSLTLLKEKDKTPYRISLEYVRTCPEPGCQFQTVMDYDFPPHVAHLALLTFNKAQTYEYDDYEDYTVDDLKLVTEMFCHCVKKPEECPPPTEEPLMTDQLSQEICDQKDRISKIVTDMEAIKDAALKENEKMQIPIQYGPECPREVTKEIIEQIFIDHPSLTNCVLDL